MANPIAAKLALTDILKDQQDVKSLDVVVVRFYCHSKLGVLHPVC
jgi:hypothetical protein